MKIDALEISDLRIIERLMLEPAAGLNMIQGGNGAGKTSILEAIYLAGRGRSFRHTSSGPMIRRGADATTVVLRLSDKMRHRAHRLGIRRGRKAFECRLDGDDVTKRSTLAETMPVQWLGSQPQQFLDRGPDVRRRFFDMGMFHVEQDYLSLYAEFSRTLKQRNAALKTGSPDTVLAWNKQFANAGEALHRRREDFVDSLLKAAAHQVTKWELDFDIEYRYRRGWSQDDSLDEELVRKLDLDLRMGFTSVGPHRAEVELLTADNAALAERTLSRGQQKMLVIALNLAVLDLIGESGRSLPVVLVDDLGAELDDGNRRKVLDAFDKRSVQVFITAISEKGPLSERAQKVFHVEQGGLVQDPQV